MTLKPTKDGERYSDEETQKRFTAALARALSTPHKPHIAKKKKVTIGKTRKTKV